MKIAHTEYGLIRVSGPDRWNFLQGQFSQDVHNIRPDRGQISSYNTHQGRVFSVLFLFSLNESIYLVLPQERIKPVINRLQIFILRSQVKLEALERSVFGLIDFDVQPVWHFWAENEGYYLQLPQKLGLWLGPAEQAAPLEHWIKARIQAGLPTVWNQTAELFVPQMLNLDWLEGISFNKGCYTGQEVIARMHYLGQLKKRLYRARFDGQPISIGDPLYCAENRSAQGAGKVVDQINDEQGGSALVVASIALVESDAEFRLKDERGAVLQIEPVPYVPADNSDQ